jgi:hypothetical protein
MFNPVTKAMWTCPDPATAPDKDTKNAMRTACWASFVSDPTQPGGDPNGFALKNLDGTSAPYDAKSIYFLPSCEPEEPRGTTGGGFYGIRAEIPVLVK